MSGYREHDARVYIEIAEKKLRICDKYAVEEPRMYRKMIAGESTFSVRRQDERGSYEQCSWAVMEALYNRKQSEPDMDIGEIFQQALLDEFAETISPVRLKNCVDCLLYQLNSGAEDSAVCGGCTAAGGGTAGQYTEEFGQICGAWDPGRSGGLRPETVQPVRYA